MQTNSYLLNVINGFIPIETDFKEIEKCINTLNMKYITTIHSSFDLYINDNLQILMMPKSKKVEDFYNFIDALKDRYFKRFASKIITAEDLIDLINSISDFYYPESNENDFNLLIYLSILSCIKNDPSKITKNPKVRYLTNSLPKLFCKVWKSFDDYNFYIPTQDREERFYWLLNQITEVINEKNTYEILNALSFQIYYDTEWKYLNNPNDNERIKEHLSNIDFCNQVFHKMHLNNISSQTETLSFSPYLSVISVFKKYISIDKYIEKTRFFFVRILFFAEIIGYKEIEELSDNLEIIKDTQEERKYFYNKLLSFIMEVENKQYGLEQINKYSKQENKRSSLKEIELLKFKHFYGN